MTLHQLPIVTFIKAHTIVSAIVLFVLLVAVKMFYTSPTNSLKYTEEHAIQQARILASAIVNGDVNYLIYLAADQTVIDKLHESPIPSFRDITEQEVYKTSYISPSHQLFRPIHATFSPSASRMQLISLERKKSFFVMTFAALVEPNFGDFIEADGRPLIVTVVVRYFESQPTNFVYEWGKRLINIDWLPSSIRATQSGNWCLVNYRYSYSLHEYYDWVRSNEKRLHEHSVQIKQKWDSMMEKDNWFDNWFFDLFIEAPDQVESMEKWSSIVSQTQFSVSMNQLSMKQKRVDEKKPVD